MLRLEEGDDPEAHAEAFDELRREAGRGTTMAFMVGYLAAQSPDDPPSVPSPPALRLAVTVGSAAIDAFGRRTGSWLGYGAVGLVLGLPYAWAMHRLERAASRRRALRMGLRRRTDTPPVRFSVARIAMAIAIGVAHRAHAKRRGTWPPSFATLAGWSWATALDAERQWRSDLREWRTVYQR